MKRPRLNALRTFEAAGRRQSFSLAAEYLNISQAAVSQQIRQLEAYLGKPLFVRAHKRITLTNIGLSYWKSVHEALEKLDSVTDDLFEPDLGKTVSIHCTSSVATLWLAPHISEFRARNPDIELNVITLEQPETNTADIEVFVSTDSAPAPNTSPLLTSIVTPVAAPEYIADMPLARPQDILNFNLIHVVGYDDDWYRWFAKHDLNPQQIPHGLSADSSLFAIDAALRGEGVFLGRRPFIDSYLRNGKLTEVFKTPYHLTARYYMGRNPATRNSRSHNIVCEWLTGLAMNQIESGKPVHQVRE